MPPSMRKQTAANKRRNIRDDLCTQQRRHALHLLRQQKRTSTIVSNTGISKTTLHRIRTALKSNSHSKIEQLLNPAKHRAGQKAVIGTEESKLIVEHMTRASDRGFAVNVATAKHIMGSIANEERSGFE
ncbi:hypothetical protein FGB62_111g017 [Gracilaria domingensis]|nr:hypothetical protein FGB62_111g017 [Gracilaria domingensis]